MHDCATHALEVVPDCVSLNACETVSVTVLENDAVRVTDSLATDVSSHPSSAVMLLPSSHWFVIALEVVASCDLLHEELLSTVSLAVRDPMLTQWPV